MTAESGPAAHATGGDARDRLLLAVSRAHYEDELSKVEIARRHGISRFQVASLLKEARERGIVRITIGLPEHEGDHRHLAARLGIEAVLSTPHEGVPGLLAGVVAQHATPGTRVGISWSRVIQQAVPLLPELTDCDVVQLAGAISVGSEDGAVRLLAGVTCRRTWPLWAPLVVPHARHLRESPEVAETLERATGLDLAVVAVGRWGPGTSTVWERVPETLRERTLAAGAVAEVSGHLLDGTGRQVDEGIEEVVVSASLADLADAGRTVVVARGADRAEAVLAAHRGGLVDVLVADEALTHELERLLGSSDGAA